MAKDASVEAVLKGFATMLKAANLEEIGNELVGAFTTMVSSYRAMKADTEAERAARTGEFAAALVTLREKIDTALIGACAKVLADTRPTIDDLKAATTRECTSMLIDMRAKVDARLAEITSGETPSDQRLRDLIVPLIPDPIAGSPDTADDIRNKLELLTGRDRLNVSAIDGLTELFAEFDKKIGGVRGSFASALTGRDLFNDIDLSPQLDGVTTTFQIHAVYNIISVHLSSFPHALRKNIDFTYTPTTISFDPAQIDPSTSLAQGQTAVLTVVNA